MDDKQADGPPDVKWSPLPIHICNTRGLANALPSQRESWNVSCVCNYTGSHTLQTGTQPRCFAAEIGMVSFDQTLQHFFFFGRWEIIKWLLPPLVSDFYWLKLTPCSFLCPLHSRAAVSLSNNPQPRQASALTGPSSCWHLSLWGARGTRTRRRHGLSLVNVRTVSYPLLTVHRPVSTVAGSRLAAPDAQSVSRGGWDARLSASAVPPSQLCNPGRHWF